MEKIFNLVSLFLLVAGVLYMNYDANYSTWCFLISIMYMILADREARKSLLNKRK